MTLDIHITVELQSSSQLVDLLHAIYSRQPEPKQPTMPSMGETERMLHPGPEQPEKKPQEAKEPPKGPAPKPHEPQKWDPLIEIPKFPIQAGTTPEHIPVQGTSPHFGYIETGDGGLWIRYISGNIWTTWKQIMKLERSLPSDQKKFGKLLNYSDLGNRRTAINYMIKAIRAGLVPGQAAGSQEDQDADFRAQLPPGTVDTSTGYDGGKLEGSLED